MTKSWRPYAQHIVDAIKKLERIQARGDLIHDEVLYDAYGPSPHPSRSIAFLAPAAVRSCAAVERKA